MLILPIKQKWFDMILSGKKKEEYREIKPYYTKRFQTIGLLDRHGLPTTAIKTVILRNGYSVNSRQVIADVAIDIKQGNPEWGAEPDKVYYCLLIKNTCRANSRRKRCKNYIGVACIDGSCPKANKDEYEERCMDVINNCDDCPYYEGCKDCAYPEINKEIDRKTQ